MYTNANAVAKCVCYSDILRDFIEKKLYVDFKVNQTFLPF